MAKKKATKKPVAKAPEKDFDAELDAMYEKMEAYQKTTDQRLSEMFNLLQGLKDSLEEMEVAPSDAAPQTPLNVTQVDPDKLYQTTLDAVMMGMVASHRNLNNVFNNESSMFSLVDKITTLTDKLYDRTIRKFAS